MSFVILPKKDPKKLQNSWAPSLTTVHISIVGWDQGGGVVTTASVFVNSTNISTNIETAMLICAKTNQLGGKGLVIIR